MLYPSEFIRYTSIMKYLTCPRQWYQDYVLDIASAEQRDSLPLYLGTLFHESIEKLYETDNIEQAREVLFSAKNEQPRFRKVGIEKLERLLNNYHIEVYPRYQGRIQYIEHEYMCNIEGVSVPYRSKIDLITSDGLIIDLKTTGFKRPNLEHSLQLDLYSFGYYAEFGILPRGVEYHYADKETGRVEVVNRTVEAKDIMKAVGTVRMVMRGIEHDVFPQSYTERCKWCTHDEICDLDRAI